MTTGDSLAEAVEQASLEVDGRLTLGCGEAFALAEKHGVGVGEIGRLCNERRIKLTACQLGCFK